jgi:hypothetical protein
MDHEDSDVIAWGLVTGVPGKERRRWETMRLSLNLWLSFKAFVVINYVSNALELSTSYHKQSSIDKAADALDHVGCHDTLKPLNVRLPAPK